MIYIYIKLDDIKIFNHGDLTILEHNRLIKNDWKHTATLDSGMFLKSLFYLSDEERLKKLKELYK